MAERHILFVCDQRPILERLVGSIESEYQKVQRGEVTADEALGYIFEQANVRLLESGARPVHVLTELTPNPSPSTSDRGVQVHCANGCLDGIISVHQPNCEYAQFNPKF